MYSGHPNNFRCNACGNEAYVFVKLPDTLEYPKPYCNECGQKVAETTGGRIVIGY